MKKEKKPEKKSVDFSVKPFRALKSFQTESKAPESAVPLVEPSPPPPSDEDDAAIFQRAVANVKRLHPSEKQVENKKKEIPPGRKLEEEERSVFLKEVEKLLLDVKFQDELPDDVTPLRKPASNRQRELEKGSIRIGLELDLHGLTRDEALTSLDRFISGAYNRDQNAVLVITGKGNNSPVEPVLQMAVSGWLRDRGRGMVAEFAPAPRQLGGSGAFVVFLKKREPSPSKPTLK
jgi:DNA-nicking Smr family endonuclease